MKEIRVSKLLMKQSTTLNIFHIKTRHIFILDTALMCIIFPFEVRIHLKKKFWNLGGTFVPALKTCSVITICSQYVLSAKYKNPLPRVKQQSPPTKDYCWFHISVSRPLYFWIWFYIGADRYASFLLRVIWLRQFVRYHQILLVIDRLSVHLRKTPLPRLYLFSAAQPLFRPSLYLWIWIHTDIGCSSWNVGPLWMKCFIIMSPDFSLSGKQGVHLHLHYIPLINNALNLPYPLHTLLSSCTNCLKIINNL